VETEVGALELDDAPLPEPESLLLVAVGVVVVVAVLLVAVVVLVVVALRDSTGSWPLASVTAITSQAATNRATAPPTIRRRSLRARCRRAAFSCVPRFSMPVGSSAPIANS
jgi:hypothetical protein